MRAFLSLLLLTLTGLSIASPANAWPNNNQPQDRSLDQLEDKLKSQYATVENIIANPPGAALPAVVLLPGQSPHNVEEHRQRIRQWQDDLARSFKAAADTVAEILKLNPPNRDYWNERLATLRLYSQPVSPPEERNVFGAREVQKSARLLDTPLPHYTNEAQAAKVRGDVRLRLVLGADGTVKHVFPIKSLRYGLTESAMAAAGQIKFEPAIRNGSPVSQFITLVYEFENGRARKPYIPRTVF